MIEPVCKIVYIAVLTLSLLLYAKMRLLYVDSTKTSVMFSPVIREEFLSSKSTVFASVAGLMASFRFLGFLCFFGCARLSPKYECI